MEKVDGKIYIRDKKGRVCGKMNKKKDVMSCLFYGVPISL